MNKTEEINESEGYSKVTVFSIGRSVYFFDEVNNQSVAEAFKIFQILETRSQKQPIRLCLNSSGGDIYSGLALYDRIKISPCKVITIATGLVASMGLIIFMAGEERAITPTGALLHHQNSMSMMNLRTSDIKIEAKEMTRLENLTNQIVSTASGQTIKILKESIRDGDKYIYPAEALTTGYVHKLVPYFKEPVKLKKGK